MEGSQVKLIVDHDRCEGHGRCYELAATLVEADEDGRAVLSGDSSVARSEEAAASLAIRNCPEGALSLSPDL